MLSQISSCKRNFNIMQNFHYDAEFSWIDEFSSQGWIFLKMIKFKQNLKHSSIDEFYPNYEFLAQWCIFITILNVHLMINFYYNNEFSS